MAESPHDALEKIHLGGKSAAFGEDDVIDHILNEQRPTKRAKKSRDELKRELEDEFLAPSSSFSEEWLNKLQQYIFSLLRNFITC